MRRKILTNFIVVLLVSSLVTGALAFNFIESSYKKVKEEKLLSNINLIGSTLKEVNGDWEDINFHRLVQNLSSYVNSRVTFISVDGQVIADSSDNSIIFQEFDLTPEFRYAIRRKIQMVQRYSREVGNKYFYLALFPIKISKYDIMVRLGDPYREMDYIIENFVTYGLLYIIAGLVFAIVLGYIVAGKITKPIKALTEVSKQIARGDLEKRVKVEGKDEIKELSVSFNIMASKLKFTIDELKDKNAKMDAILASIQDGLIAMDQDGKVILINDSAKKILNIKNNIKIGSYIDELAIERKIMDEIQKAKMDNNMYSSEIKIGGNNKKIVQLSTSIIQEKNGSGHQIGTLLIIRDVTSIRNLENMRKDFVSNVSHELRTPLTSIGGFVETLKIKELDNKSRYKALDIIEFETERLKALINNLLKLSEIENIENVKHLAIIDIKNDLFEVKRLLKPQAENKDIDIILDIEEDLNTINGDRNWFRLIAINLIENSIKYTEEGGIINVGLYNYTDGVKLVVEDKGIGIPEEDLSRIFERFYRVDKSRSNSIKGSGLGLSIVKNIVKLFRGTIEVESQLGEGSKFTVFLPR